MTDHEYPQCMFCSQRKKNRYTPVKKVQVGKDQEKAQSEKDSHSNIQGGKKTN